MCHSLSSYCESFKKDLVDNSYGKIYIVSTPIGNLKDITFRAIDILKEVDLIAAEDTRRTMELLNHFNIDTKITSYHEHNKYEKAIELVDKIKEGLSIAMVTDAGTPIISDPGNELVKLAIEENIEVLAVPGACAAINALVVSGLDARSFVFVGFLSDDNKKRKEQLEELKNETRTMIFYVSPHSFKKDIETLANEFGDDRQVSVSREMTKIHEETLRGTLKEIMNAYGSKEVRGEFVLVVSGLDKEIVKTLERDKWQNLSIEEHFNMYIEDGLSDKDAIKKVAIDRGINKREVYKFLKVK